MWPSIRLIPHLSNLPSYGSYSATLLSNDETTIVWTCTHVHSFPSTAYECAEYEKNKQQNGR